MKRVKIILAALIMVFSATQVSAQVRYGFLGGANFSESNCKNWTKDKLTQYQAGFTVQIKLPYGFAVQPSLLYQAKGLKFTPAEGQTTPDGSAVIEQLKLGFIELPVSIQWGLDLLVVRPYVEVVPFIGYGVANNKYDWNDLNRFEGGIGVGGGIDIWKFQISARYNWNFGSLAKIGGALDESIKNTDGVNPNKNLNFGGATLSVAILF